MFAFRATQIAVEQAAADGEEAPEAPEPAAAPAARASRAKVQDDILARLRQLQAKKHTLDVAHDILQDQRVKIYAWMLLGSRIIFATCCIIDCVLNGLVL